VFRRYRWPGFYTRLLHGHDRRLSEPRSVDRIVRSSSVNGIATAVS
jgi:hypothetical protein